MINWIGRTEIYALRAIERLGGVIIDTVDQLARVLEEVSHVVAEEIGDLVQMHAGAKTINVYGGCAAGVGRTGQADSIDVRIEIRDGEIESSPSTTFLCVTVTDLDPNAGLPDSEVAKARARACAQRLGELLSVQVTEIAGAGPPGRSRATTTPATSFCGRRMGRMWSPRSSGMMPTAL